MKLTLSGKEVYRKEQYIILLMDDFDDLYIVVDTSDNDTMGFSYHIEYMKEHIDTLIFNDPVCSPARV